MKDQTTKAEDQKPLKVKDQRQTKQRPPMKDQRPQRTKLPKTKQFVCITNDDPGSKLGDEKKAFRHLCITTGNPGSKLGER